MPQIGEKAPDFTLTGTDGENIWESTLSDYTDAGYVILSFYITGTTGTTTPRRN